MSLQYKMARGSSNFLLSNQLYPPENSFKYGSLIVMFTEHMYTNDITLLYLFVFYVPKSTIKSENVSALYRGPTLMTMLI